MTMSWTMIRSLSCLWLVGCASQMNPSFPVTTAQAKAAMRQMWEDPQPFERPVVVAAGLLDPGFDVQRIADSLRRITTGENMVTSVTFMSLTTGSFDGCRDYLIERVEETFGTTDSPETIEVDVIGFSMGGLVARHASRRRSDGGKRLAIRRLFTISTPHRGARMAQLPTLDQRAVDMRADSEFLAELDEALPEAEYELYSYARLGDWIVGVENAAPPGLTAWWVPSPPLSFAHLGAANDPRILADIALRLRGEAALTTAPPRTRLELSTKPEIDSPPQASGP